jgi:hypothetical protein
LIVESTDTTHSIRPASAPAACRLVTIAAQLPGAKQAIDRLPGAVALGHIPPRTAGAGAKPDAVDQLPKRPAPGPAKLLADRQQRLQ